MEFEHGLNIKLPKDRIFHVGFRPLLLEIFALHHGSRYIVKSVLNYQSLPALLT